MNERYEKLLADIKRYRRVAVCLSGGSDSALLTKLALDALGRENVLALTANTDFFTEAELKLSEKLCRTLGVTQKIVRVHLLSENEVVENPKDRCYFCKKILLSKLGKEAEAAGFSVLLDGQNASDALDYRPGARAAKEYGVKSPLAEAGVTKKEIYSLLEELSLTEFIRPANACLATRVATGERITLKKLRQICAMENSLHSFGFDFVRTRLQGNSVSIEVAPERVAQLKEHRERIFDELSSFGFDQVEIAEGGYQKSGLRETDEKPD